MKKTLVIHPDDRSTDFLKLIYCDKNYDVINHYVPKDELKRIIEGYDRIIMMGHGTGNGLLNPEALKGGRYIDLFRSPLYQIDDSFGELLATKETITVWCYSDEYCRKHNLKGFHTSMIISEVREAEYVLGYSDLGHSELLANMQVFANAIGECIESSPEKMVEYVLRKYDFDNDITQFNRKNIKVL